MIERNPRVYSNESAETRGGNLEQVYADVLGGRIVGGMNDGGMDVVFDDVPEVPIVQIKSSWPIAAKFLAESLRRMEFIPLLVGDPGQHTKEEIFESLIENGGWVGIDVANREKSVENIRKVRDHIYASGGRQKGLPGDKRAA